MTYNEEEYNIQDYAFLEFKYISSDVEQILRNHFNYPRGAEITALMKVNQPITKQLGGYKIRKKSKKKVQRNKRLSKKC